MRCASVSAAVFLWILDLELFADELRNFEGGITEERASEDAALDLEVARLAGRRAIKRNSESASQAQPQMRSYGLVRPPHLSQHLGNSFQSGTRKSQPHDEASTSRLTDGSIETAGGAPSLLLRRESAVLRTRQNLGPASLSTARPTGRQERRTVRSLSSALKMFSSA